MYYLIFIWIPSRYELKKYKIPKDIFKKISIYLLYWKIPLYYFLLKYENKIILSFLACDSRWLWWNSFFGENDYLPFEANTSFSAKGFIVESPQKAVGQQHEINLLIGPTDKLMFSKKKKLVVGNLKQNQKMLETSSSQAAPVVEEVGFLLQVRILKYLQLVLLSLFLQHYRHIHWDITQKHKLYIKCTDIFLFYLF